MDPLWCVECGDLFDYDDTMLVDEDTPLCSAECQEAYETAAEAAEDYWTGYRS